MGFESTFSKDVWHREAQTIARRNGIRTRRWGMRVTVYDDPTPANNGEWVLEYNQANTDRQSNLNWLKVADIGQTWGGGGGITTADNGLTVNPAGNVQLGGTLIDHTSIDGDNGTFAFGVLDAAQVVLRSTNGTDENNLFVQPNLTTLSVTDGTDLSTFLVGPSDITASAAAGGEIALYIDNGSNYWVTLTGSLFSAISESVQITAINDNLNLSAGDELNMGGTNYAGISSTDGDIEINQLSQGTQIRLDNAGGFSVNALNGFIGISSGGDVELQGGFGASEITADQAGNIDFSATSFSLNGSPPSSPSTEFFRGDGTWAVPGGGSVTADNGLTLSSGNIQWGGALIQDTFIPSPTTPRSVRFGFTSGFTQQPLLEIVGLTNNGVTFFSGGAVVNSPNISLAPNGIFVNNQFTANTNNTGINIQERSVRSTGAPAAGFGGREQVGVEITLGLGGAVTHEYVALDVSGAGEFQWNICQGTVNDPIPNTDVVQSFIMRDRNVGFFTKDTDYGSGSGIIKVANAPTPANALVANSILMWAEDTSDSLSSLAFFTEQAEEVIGATVATHKLKIQLNGTEYYLLLSTI